MNASRAQPHVHLVGSVPLADSESVFRTVAARLGPHQRRLPDGETGKRGEWIRFIQAMLTQHKDMEVDPTVPPLAWRQWDGVLLREIPRVRFKAGVDPLQVRFDLGYGQAAVESFRIFDKLQAEGAVPARVKFQVCLPTPLAPGYNYVSPPAQDDFLRAFEPAMVREIAHFASALPHDRLAVQWDVCQEVLMYEGYYPERPRNYVEQIQSELERIGAAIPRDIELGYHLCYGSPRDEHIVQPKDMGIMVEMANGIFSRAARSIEFIHLPVPRDRTDDAFFAPLKSLKLPTGCELILGLVHEGDAAGTKARLAAARRVALVAGIGTECGWGRKNPERLPGVLAAHEV